MLIGEVARRSGVSARMLRHYESLGLLQPHARSVSGYREYSAEDIGRIFHIEGLRALGLGLSEIGRLLDDPGFAPEELIGDLIAQSRRRIESERELLTRLEQFRQLRHSDGEALLLTIDLIRSMGSGDVIQRHKAALGSGVDGQVPVEMLAEAVLTEPVINAAGAMRWALAKAGSRAVEHVVGGMSDPDARVRRNALLALDEVRRHGHLDLASEKAVRETLRAGLQDVDGEVAASAALILGRMGDPRAVDELLRLALSGPKDIEAAEVLAGYVAGGLEPDSGGHEPEAGEGARVDEGAEVDARAGADEQGGADGRAGVEESRGASARESSGRGAPVGTHDDSEPTLFHDTVGTVMTELRRAVHAHDSTKRFRALQILMELPPVGGEPSTAEKLEQVAGEAADAAPEVHRAPPQGRRGPPRARHVASQAHRAAAQGDHRFAAEVMELIIVLSRDSDPRVAATAAAELSRRRGRASTEDRRPSGERRGSAGAPEEMSD